MNYLVKDNDELYDDYEEIARTNAFPTSAFYSHSLIFLFKTVQNRLSLSRLMAKHFNKPQLILIVEHFLCG